MADAVASFPLLAGRQCGLVGASRETGGGGRCRDCPASSLLQAMRLATDSEVSDRQWSSLSLPLRFLPFGLLTSREGEVIEVGEEDCWWPMMTCLQVLIRPICLTDTAGVAWPLLGVVVFFLFCGVVTAPGLTQEAHVGVAIAAVVRIIKWMLWRIGLRRRTSPFC